MHAHHAKVVVTENHEVKLKLPSEFPPGCAELILVAPRDIPCGEEYSRHYHQQLDSMLKRGPSEAPVSDEVLESPRTYDD